MIDRCATMGGGRSWSIRALSGIGAILVFLVACPSRAEDDATPPRRGLDRPRVGPGRLGDLTARLASQPTADAPMLERLGVPRSLHTIVLFGAFSLVPVALLMVTAFVRINIVLTLLRQALGSPQVPGNQVLTALALMLTVLVMWPHGRDGLSQGHPALPGEADRRGGRLDGGFRSRSRGSWSSRSSITDTRTTSRPSTSTRRRPAPARPRPRRPRRRTSRSAS